MSHNISMLAYFYHKLSFMNEQPLIIYEICFLLTFLKKISFLFC